MDKPTGAEVRALREKLGLDRAQLAERLLLKHPDTVRAWENDRTPISGSAWLAMQFVDRLSNAGKAARAVLDGLWRGA